MSIAAQVDGLAGALLRCVEEPERIPLLQSLLDRYCHRLRNRLNSMKLSLYLSRRLSGEVYGPEWVRADLAYRTIEMTIEQVQLFCNPLQAMPVDGDLDVWVRDHRTSWEKLLVGHPVHLEYEPSSEPLPTQFDWYRLAQGLHGLVLYWAGLEDHDCVIRLSWGRELNSLFLRFESDSSIVRPKDSTENLALPVLARVLMAHGGTLLIPASETSIILTWPSECPRTSSG